MSLHVQPARQQQPVRRPWRRKDACKTAILGYSLRFLHDVNRDVTQQTAFASLALAGEQPVPTGYQANAAAVASLSVLEWPSICRQLASFCQTTIGASRCLNCQIPIYTSISDCQTLQSETLEARGLALDLSGLLDIRALLQLPDKETAAGVQDQRVVLQAAQLAMVSTTIQCMLRVRAQVLDAECPALAMHAEDVSKELQAVLEALQHAIDAQTAMVRDCSSEQLSEVRKAKTLNQTQLQQEIDSYCRLLHQRGASDLKAPVMRRDRLCCSVKRGRSGILPKGSITLATSQTGSTLYMEPKPVIDLNNAASELQAAEEAEELVVLTVLTQMLVEKSHVLHAALKAFTRIDLATARARHAEWMCAAPPTLLSRDTQASIVDLAGIRHPLLLQPCLSTLPDPPTDDETMTGAVIEQRPVNARNHSSQVEQIQSDQAPTSWPEPLDLTIPDGVRVVALTGANTGGKTSCLKALGISVLMAQAGMWLHCDQSMRPTAADGRMLPPQVPVFDGILADLGDSQSLQQSLSTFSGHMRQVNNIVQACGPGSLVLLDELGSGTDPSEGAALAIAILRRLSHSAALTFMTTHYPEIKEEATQNPSFINAAVDFDLETLKPTYRLSWGSQGSSNALMVAQQLGFDREVLARGKEWVDRLSYLTQSKSKASHVAAEITKQIELGTRMRAESAQTQLNVETHVANLEEQLHKVAAEAKELRGQAKHVTADANKEARKLQRLEDQVSQGRLTVREALERLGEVRGNLPQVADAQRRLLGLQMGASAESLTPEQESESSSESESEKDWMPQVMKMGGASGVIMDAPSSWRGNSQVQVDVGGLVVSAKLSDLRRATQPRRTQQPANHTRKKKTRIKSNQSAGSLPLASESGTANGDHGPAGNAGVGVQVSANTIDVRGQRANIALMHVEEELSEKSNSGVVFIVHGVGTGALRSEIHRFLRADSQVKRFELEEKSNGGCTIVYF